MVKSAYIHIPFCYCKCNYCSFISYENISREERDLYVDALINDINHSYRNETMDTIYFGGGTPSLLTVSQIDRILNCFNITDKTEITLEINPETVSLDYLFALKHSGVNRISVGIQTFSDDILKQIGRLHSSATAIETVSNLDKAGFENISLDFIYGLPNQNIFSFLSDLKKAVSLGVQHISLYGLKIEEGCKFYKIYGESGPKNTPDNDVQADMYLAAIELLSDAGFKQYEISNFSLSGFESKHNLVYWDASEYYGFGVAAHGYVNGCRYSNEESMDLYIANPKAKRQFFELTQSEKLEEKIFLGFRKSSGINVNEINSSFGINFEQKYSSIIRKYQSSNHIIKTDNGYAFSDIGFLLSNIILAEFIH